MRNTFFFAAVFWTLLITILCLVSVGDLDDGMKIPHKDKYVHFTFYFIFTILWFVYFKVKSLQKTKRIRLLVFIMAVFYGIFIEICQGVFTVARSADVLDVLANTSGSAIAVLALWLIEKNKKN